MTTTRQWDYGSRLRSIANTVDGVAVTSHSYLYDGWNRRRQATLEDGSLWKYDYNDRDELISGKRYWQDWTPVAGQQFEYGFDNIGNRQTAKEGGDANGANLRTENYTANGLNQYTSRTVPDKMDVIGAAYATATATVNNNATYRKGEYYQYALSVTNTSYPAWQGVTNKAVQGTNSEAITNHALVSPATQTLQYDKDGNLTNDAVWVYSWDGENRLIQMTNLTTVPEAARKKLVFGYDFMNRRVTKTVYGWDSGTSSWNTTAELDQKFIYDGWNLIALVNADSSINTFTWGHDLSGTMDKAGGVGGLLMTSLSGTNCFVGYDGNGNATVLIVASDKSIGARYEHNPFGKTIRATGLFAKNNPIRFSSKYEDDQTGFLYFIRRYYNPEIGRWINPDPIGHTGGLNLHAFVENDAINWIDYAGEKKWVDVWNLTKAIVDFGLAITGHDIEEGAETVAKEMSEAIEKAGEEVETGAKIVGGAGGKGKKPRMFTFGGSWKSAKGRVRSPKTKALGAIGMIFYVTSDQPAADAASFAKNATDLYKDIEHGLSGMSDLDAAMVYIDSLNLFGNSAVAASIWSELPE